MGPPGEGKGKGEGRGDHQKKVRPDKKSCKKVWTEFDSFRGFRVDPLHTGMESGRVG